LCGNVLQKKDLNAANSVSGAFTSPAATQAVGWL